jgi:DNA repair/transcription protein MET18/MMS19
MSSEEVSIRLSTLETFLMLITEATSLVEQHLSTLVPKLVELATKDISAVTRYLEFYINLFKDMRLLASTCLYSVAQLPFPKIFPFKMQVINGLVKAVDDNKRAVRKEAAKARNEWFTISA